jgi:hypothetical protein
MTEEGQLRESADRSHALQRAKDMNNYIDLLSERIDYTQKRYNDSNWIYLVAWLSWVIVGFLHDYVSYQIMTFVFILALFYTSVRLVEWRNAVGMLIGTIRTLEILGFVDPIQRSDGKKKKKRLWSEGFDIVKRWAFSKKSAQEKVYKPA